MAGLTDACASMQVAASLQTVLGMPQPSQPTDIERFLSLTTPILPSKSGAHPKLVRRCTTHFRRLLVQVCFCTHTHTHTERERERAQRETDFQQ